MLIKWVPIVWDNKDKQNSFSFRASDKTDEQRVEMPVMVAADVMSIRCSLPFESLDFDTLTLISWCWYCECRHQLSVTNCPGMASLMRPKLYISVRLYCGFSNMIIAMFMGPTWGPPGSCRPQMGPMLTPWTWLSGILAPYKWYPTGRCIVTIKWMLVRCGVVLSVKFDIRWRSVSFSRGNNNRSCMLCGHCT